MSSSRNHFSIEPRPRMLKDFLINDSSSCFSNNKSSSSSLLRTRSRSKTAASTTISVLQAIISTVKSSIVKFNVVKSPSILPRSFSRKLSEKNSNKEIINDVKLTVRVKDIIRWRSFRDSVDEKPQPSDLASSSPDHHCTTTTTTTGSTNSTPCSSSNGSSWCESDFTTEYLPAWSGNISGKYAENDAVVSEKYLPCVGRDLMKATIESAVDTAVGPKELQCEEKEERSPDSVLDFELEEDEHSVSSFDHVDDDDSSSAAAAAADVEEETNEVEEKAKLLLNHVRSATSSLWSCKESNIVSLEQLLMDFFVDGLGTKKRNQSEVDYEIDHHVEIIRQAEAWIKGESTAACVRDMGNEIESWKKFDGEQREVSLQIENTLLNLLLDDLLVDL